MDILNLLTRLLLWVAIGSFDLVDPEKVYSRNFPHLVRGA